MSAGPDPEVAKILLKKIEAIGRAQPPEGMRWKFFAWPEGQPKFPMPFLRYCMECSKYGFENDEPVAVDIKQFVVHGVKLRQKNVDAGLYFAGQCPRCLVVYWTKASS